VNKNRLFLGGVIFCFLGVAGIQSGFTAPAPTGYILSTHARCMMGRVANKQWLMAKEDEKLEANISTPGKYDLYSLKESRTGEKATPLKRQGYPCDSYYYVDLKSDTQGAYTALGGINWNPVPRAVKHLNPNSAAYKKVVADFLKENGLVNPVIKIENVLKTDIQGDGKDEVFIVATYFAKTHRGYNRGDTPLYSLKGEYSIVLFREVIDEKPVTRLVVGEIHLKDTLMPEPPSVAPNLYSINAILDVKGDGVMEVVVDDRITEGSGAGVYVLENNKFTRKLYCGCGY